MIGKQFGKLTVIDTYGKNRQSRKRWLCRCECGNELPVLDYNLKNGNSQSCGCVSKDKLGNRRRTHGMSNTKIYRIWRGMRNRCNNVNVPEYQYYGGRGISICEEWSDFSAFYEWAKANGYTEGLSIDRIDNDGDYCPENCTWVTRVENTRKMDVDRHTKLVGLYHGKSPEGNEYTFDNAAEFARQHNISRSSIKDSIKFQRPREGWTFWILKDN